MSAERETCPCPYVAITVLHRITQPAQLVADCMEERTDGECTFYSPQHPPPSNASFCSHHCARWRRRDLQAIIHLIFVAPTNDCGGGDASPGLYVSGGYLRVNIFVYNVIYAYQYLPRYCKIAHLGAKPRAMRKSSGGGGSQSALEQPKKERRSVRRSRGGGRRGYLREGVKSWKQCSSSPVFYDDGCQVCKVTFRPNLFSQLVI